MTADTAKPNDIMITGIGLVSSQGEGCDAHWSALGTPEGAKPVVDSARFAPYSVHPLVELDFSKQIPRKGDQRQMEPWQRIGVYTAGLALADAGVAGEPELLERTHMIVAAGSGERDTAMDTMLLENTTDKDGSKLSANEVLRTELRPTLFLAQLSNLLAGNISIIHKVTASSRTFMGEEMAGLSAVEVAAKRIASGQGDLFLVGGAYNSEREDLLLILELGRNLYGEDFASVWERNGDSKDGDKAGGIIPGSVGAFLVLESRAHAEARGARVYAQLSGIATGRCSRKPGQSQELGADLFAQLAKDTTLTKGELPVLSGAGGTEPATAEELAFLETVNTQGFDTAIRAYGSVIGHSVEAHFPAGLALAALSLSNGSFYQPFDKSGTEKPFTGSPERILVTGWGHWRGEGLALVEKVS